MTKPTPSRPPITDSAWFWVYLYAAVGLILLAVLQPKYGQRQAGIERQFQGRQRAMDKQLGKELSEQKPFSTPESTIISLRPLYLSLAGACLIGWVVLWWRHFRRRVPETTAATKETSP